VTPCILVGDTIVLEKRNASTFKILKLTMDTRVAEENTASIMGLFSSKD